MQTKRSRRDTTQNIAEHHYTPARHFSRSTVAHTSVTGQDLHKVFMCDASMSQDKASTTHTRHLQHAHPQDICNTHICYDCARGLADRHSSVKMTRRSERMVRACAMLTSYGDSKASRAIFADDVAIRVSPCGDHIIAV